jgi:hypothetical protein
MNSFSFQKDYLDLGIKRLDMFFYLQTVLFIKMFSLPLTTKEINCFIGSIFINNFFKYEVLSIGR